MSNFDRKAHTVAIKKSFEVENLSPSESPSTVGDSRGDMIGDSDLLTSSP